MSEIVPHVGHGNAIRIKRPPVVRDEDFKFSILNEDAQLNVLVLRKIVSVLDNVCARFIDGKRDLACFVDCEPEPSSGAGHKPPNSVQVLRLTGDLKIELMVGRFGFLLH